MELSLSTTVWKYGFLTMNIIISIFGVLLMSSGVVALGGAGSVTGAYIATTIGCLVLFVCFLGCWASLRESYKMSMAYVAITLVTVILQTIFMICFAAMKSDLMEQTAQRIEDLWEKEATHAGTMNAIQFQYYCCGKDSPQDYLVDDDDVLPDSCCLNNDCSNDGNIFSKGCAITAITFFDDQSDNLILTNVGTILIEVLAIVCAYYLAKDVKHRVQKIEQIIISE